MAAEQERAEDLSLVIEYLESHPDLFLDNPQLLSKLNIPHITGKRVHSLIEYQVERLRRSDRKLRNEVKKLKDYEYFCSTLSIEAFDVALKIEHIKTIQSLYDQFFIFLKNEFSCNKLLIYFFVEQRPRDDYRGLHFRPLHSKLRYLFSSLFTHKKPLCDSLQAEYLDNLFGKEVNHIKSTVALPITTENNLGLMVLGSNHYNAYHQGLPIHLLNYLKNRFNLRFQKLLQLEINSQ